MMIDLEISQIFVRKDFQPVHGLVRCQTAAGIVYPAAAYIALSGFLAFMALVNFRFAWLVPETGARPASGG